MAMPKTIRIQALTNQKAIVQAFDRILVSHGQTILKPNPMAIPARMRIKPRANLPSGKMAGTTEATIRPTTAPGRLPRTANKP